MKIKMPQFKKKENAKPDSPRVAAFKSSWRSIWTLIKLQFKAGVKMPRGKTRLGTVTKFGLLIGMAIAAVVGFSFIYGMIADQFILKGLQNTFLVFSFVVFFVMQLCFMVPMLIRTLDINNDREMLLRWPVSPKQIFISKVIVAYANELIFTSCILLPILISYGIAVGMGAGYWFLMPFAVILAPFFPFMIASLIMFPVQRIVNYLRSRQLLTTCIYFGLLIGMIFAYMEVINGALFVLMDNAGFAKILSAQGGKMQSLAQVFGIQWLFAHMFGEGAGWAFGALGILIVASIAFGAVGMFVAGRNYNKTYMDERTTFSALRKKAPFKKGRPLNALIRKDCLNIFRSSNYTFQFLLLVVLTPLLVYFCNRVAMAAAFHAFMQSGSDNAAKAQDMVFGASLFVIMILMPVGSSFAASAITREGHNIYHTKLIPMSFRKQLSVKAGIVFFPIVAAIVVAVGMVLIPYKPDSLSSITLEVNAMDALYILGLALCMAIGYICLGMYLDLRKPLCNQLGGGELVKSTAHINIIMGVGLVLGAGLGVVAMLGGLLASLQDVLPFDGIILFMFEIGAHAHEIYLPLAAAFAAISAGLLFGLGPRTYYRLEQ